MVLYTKISKQAYDQKTVSHLSQKFSAMARRLTLSDDEFLIMLHNKLQHMKFGQPTIGPVIRKGVRAILSVFGVKLRQVDAEPQKMVFTGMEMRTLHRLTGFKIHEELHLQDDYEMKLSVLRKLLDATKG